MKQKPKLKNEIPMNAEDASNTPALHFFMSITDPRIDRHKAHPLSTILMTAIS